MREKPNSRNTLVIVPAFNEEESIGSLLREIHQTVPELPVVVINDGSVDRTAAVARQGGAEVLDLPCNLGVGGAVQAGFCYAYENGYEYVVRCDGDGQHSPEGIATLVEAMTTNEADLIIGSRFLGESAHTGNVVRYCGINVLALMLSAICKKRVTDPTSGFQMLNRPLTYFFSRSYPVDYPEPEALALMRREGYDFMEVPAKFRQRFAGRSSIYGWGTLYYVFKVFLALVVDRARPIDNRFSRVNLEGKV
jgi:glycosyltransferase involved in cell wall biosynthesis